MSDEPTEIEGEVEDEDVTEPAVMTPGLTPDEIKTLGETATILRDTFDRHELERVSEDREQLSLCRAKGYRDGAIHNRPKILTTEHIQDRMDAANDCLLIDNLTKLSQAGFVPGVIYRSTVKGELRTVNLMDGSDGEYSIDVMGNVELTEALSKAICWVNEKGGHTGVPADMRRQLTAHHHWYPVLKALSRAPRWSRVGDKFVVFDQVGYDQATATFVTKNFVIDRKAKPNKGDVDKAVQFLLSTLAEFPFADDASKVNALALAITMALRNTWTTAPGFIITAQSPHSGKTLLTEMLHALVYAGPYLTPNKMAYKEGDQDRRNLTAMFRDVEGDVVWWDEPRLSSDSSELGSPTLNLILTTASGQYRDRPVYSKETVVLNVQKTLIISGNNLPLNPELARRTVVVSMRKDGSEVYTRTEDELREFARDNQATFHQALATIIDYWQSQGSPKSKTKFGSFNSWMEVVGGIFETIGVEGLRSNTETFVSPYGFAKAEFAAWVMENVPPAVTGDGYVDITYTSIEKAMQDPANKSTLAPLMKELFQYAPEDTKAKDAKTWSDMMDVISGTKKTQIPQLVSKAFRLVMTFDSIESKGGKVLWMKRMKGDGKKAGARIRFSEKMKTDRRAGTGANQHTVAKRTPSKRAAKQP